MIDKIIMIFRAIFYDQRILWDFLGRKLEFFPDWLTVFVAGAFALVLIAAFLVVMVMLQTWMERKIAGHIQSRHGPMRVGLFHGWAQPIADTIKLLLKEDITPQRVDLWVFRLAPIIVFIPSFMAYVCVPFGSGLMASELNVGIIYIVAVTSIVALAIIMAGWSTNNKYAAMSAFRSAAQIVSYEVPMVICVLTAIVMVGSLKMGDFVDYQNPWWIVLCPIPVGLVAFITYFIAAVAETNRAPFDLPEAEAELVAGFFVEYTGMKFALFFLAEYTNMVTVSAVATTLFLGGWRLFGLETIIPPFLIFLVKVLFLLSCIMWFRWTFPRLRIDQLMNFCWKVLLPISLVNFIITAFLANLGIFNWIYPGLYNLWGKYVPF